MIDDDVIRRSGEVLTAAERNEIQIEQSEVRVLQEIYSDRSVDKHLATVASCREEIKALHALREQIELNLGFQLRKQNEAKHKLYKLGYRENP